MTSIDEPTIFEETATMPGTGQSKRKKEKNYSTVEDVFVCSAWIHTSQDLIRGKDHTDTQFWNRAMQEYNKVHGDYPSRLAVSLKNRWSKIQRDIRKFISILGNLKSLNPSGCAEQDLEKRALDTFASESNWALKYHKCWVVLRDIPKFNGDGIVHDDFNLVHETQVHIVNLGEDDGSTSPVVKRPTGRKAAKEGEKRKDRIANMLIATEKFEQSQAQTKKHHEERKRIVEEQGERAYDLALKSYELQEKIFQVNEEAREEAKLARHEAKRAKKQAADDNAMRIDVTQMTGPTRAYWELRQRDILASMVQKNSTDSL